MRLNDDPRVELRVLLDPPAGKPYSAIEYGEYHIHGHPLQESPAAAARCVYDFLRTGARIANSYEGDGGRPFNDQEMAAFRSGYLSVLAEELRPGG